MQNTNEPKGRVGSSFDAFLKEEGILDDCEKLAIKDILVMQAEPTNPDEPSKT